MIFKSNNLKQLITIAQCLIISFLCKGQTDYQFPISPGQQAYISGTMGELRNNHFHAGLDIKTGGRTGLPVHAPASGYISRIKIQEGGYGNALYMYHPSTGHTTVYGHLERYSPAIASYVKSQQYSKKSFVIELYPDKSQFKFNKGEIIAYSGNTGGSGGPHLHFEIRDKNQHLLNPLDFNFKEVKDTRSPIIHKLAITTLEVDSRINHEFGKIRLPITKKDASNYTAKTILAHGKLGISLKTNDLLNGASNQNGTNDILMKLDGVKIFHYYNRTFSFSKTRYINTHFDYKLSEEGHGRFHNLYKQNGNRLPLYPIAKNDGYINITDTLLHKVEIICTDSYKNTSTLTFNLKGSQNTYSINKTIKNINKAYETEIINEILKISVPSKQSHILINNTKILPAVNYNNNTIFLYDMRNGVPKSIVIQNNFYDLEFQKIVFPNVKSHIYTPTADIHIPAKALYDTTTFFYKFENDTFYIHSSTTPLQRYINLKLKPMLHSTEGYHAYSMDSDGTIYFEGGTWDLNGISLKTRSLGRYFIAQDSTPPSIRYLKKGSNGEVYFKIKDNLSGIKTYKAYINGNWLLLHYDYKQELIWSDRLNKNIPLMGVLKVIVRDQAGNENFLEYKL